MSKLHEQLLKPANIPMMVQMNPNMNLLNPVPMAQPMPTTPNLPPNQNFAMGVPGPDHKSQPNPDTSN